MKNLKVKLEDKKIKLILLKEEELKMLKGGLIGIVDIDAS